LVGIVVMVLSMFVGPTNIGKDSVIGIVPWIGPGASDDVNFINTKLEIRSCENISVNLVSYLTRESREAGSFLYRVSRVQNHDQKGRELRYLHSPDQAGRKVVDVSQVKDCAVSSFRGKLRVDQ